MYLKDSENFAAAAHIILDDDVFVASSQSPVVEQDNTRASVIFFLCTKRGSLILLFQMENRGNLHIPLQMIFANLSQYHSMIQTSTYIESTPLLEEFNTLNTSNLSIEDTMITSYKRKQFRILIIYERLGYLSLLLLKLLA